MKKIILFFVISVCAYAFVEPQYSGVFDVRYVNSTTYPGAGLFKLADFELMAKFSLDPHHQLVYETHLSSSNIEWARQFYIDIDPLWMLGSLRLGRFTLPFGQQEQRLWARPFIASRVIYDAFVAPSIPFIPRSETGVGYYHHTRPFSIDLFLTNANDTTAKTMGGDCRFLIKDLLDAGFSLVLADGLFVVGTDYHMPIGPFDLAADYQLVTGKYLGTTTEGNGASGQIIYSFNNFLSLGGQFSMFNSTGIAQSSRAVLNATLLLGYDMKVRVEYMLDRLQGVNDNVLQAQCQVSL